MARKKKSNPPGTDRLNSYVKEALEEHAGADFLSMMLDTERHGELAKLLKSVPRGLICFQKFVAEYTAVIRDVEHQMSVHEFALYLSLKLQNSKAAKGDISEEAAKMHPAALVQSLFGEFMALLKTSRDLFYEKEMVEVLLSEMIWSTPDMSMEEIDKRRRELEAFVHEKTIPLLKEILGEQKAWVAGLEKKAQPKKEKPALEGIENLVFGRAVAKA